MIAAKVEGYPDFIKDLRTGAVINTNVPEIRKARLLKKKRKDDHEKIETLAQEVRELKALLQKVIENGKN